MHKRVLLGVGPPSLTFNDIKIFKRKEKVYTKRDHPVGVN
jgi:hypothetical protein